jgi:RNA polymerase sigma-70 factor (ECF subfamily)
MSPDATLRFSSSLVEEATPSIREDATPPSGIARPYLRGVEESSDESLLQAIPKGSREALDVLFSRYGRAVFHVACRILKDESEANDVRQEVFLYIFQKAHLFDPAKGAGSSWIMQIAYHRAIDRLRYLGSRLHYDAQQFDEQMSAGVPPLSTDQIDRRALLKRLKGMLSPDQQQTLDLYFFEGYTFREIAEKTGQTLGNVRNHYYRALERLRTHIFRQNRD